MTVAARSGRRALLHLAKGLARLAVLLADVEVSEASSGSRGAARMPGCCRWLSSMACAAGIGRMRRATAGRRRSQTSRRSLLGRRAGRAAYLAKVGGPSYHHEMWRSRHRLNGSDYGVDLREALANASGMMGSCDQLDVSNLASTKAWVCVFFTTYTFLRWRAIKCSLGSP